MKAQGQGHHRMCGEGRSRSKLAFDCITVDDLDHDPSPNAAVDVLDIDCCQIDDYLDMDLVEFVDSQIVSNLEYKQNFEFCTYN